MSRVIKGYSSYFNDKDFDFNKIGTGDYPIPKFSLKYIMDLCQSVIPKLEADPVLLRLSGDFVLVGDLHGNIKDLLRIFACAGSPLTTRYIFLGDYVDRGQFSIEVITLLIALKDVMPQSIFMIRGNHEFEEMNSIYGFREQVLKDYSQELFRAFNKVFSHLPLACILNQHTFIVHGGLSKLLTDIQQIEAIPKPMARYNGTNFFDLIIDLVWSDPSPDFPQYGPSPRGTGSVFGAEALKVFLKKNHMTRMIRAHQCVMNGVENFCKDKLLTIFSSSNYSSEMANKSGIVKIINNNIKCFNFPPLRVLNRERAAFKLVCVEPTHSFDNLLSAGSSPKKEEAPAPKAPAPAPQARERRHSFTAKMASSLSAGGSSPNFMPEVSSNRLASPTSAFRPAGAPPAAPTRTPPKIPALPKPRT